MTRQVVRAVPASPELIGCGVGAGRSEPKWQTQTHGLPSAGRAQIYYHRKLRFGLQPRGAQWLPVLSYARPTDANLYAPSSNEASGGDKPFAKASNVFITSFGFCLPSRSSILDVNQNQRPWLA